MKSRNRVTIQFIVEEIYVFSASCIATVKVDKDCYEIIDENYCKDIEDLEDIELVEILVDNYDDEEVPSEDDITEDYIQEIIKISLT
ncbi:hypothetical protein [uncultured Clostridium sp.]|uniref:hypothetical protein n=1 Tax=uncultured Clostridium sp. TaxID=59620 RepID=UPI0026292770|nr:hypothetical protein [uncultured Clostridium sp.]